MRSQNLQLRNQLTTFRKGDLQVDDYVAKLTSLIDEVRDSGMTIDDREIIMIVSYMHNLQGCMI